VFKFWWGSKGENRKIHWVRKEKLLKSNIEGGMGFRCIRDFNIAMLAKQVRRLDTKPESLIAKVLKAKYFPHIDPLKAILGPSPSYAWRSLHQAIWVLNKGCCWKVGNGHSINIWEDQWIPYQNGFKILTKAALEQNITLVKELILDNPQDGIRSLLTKPFSLLKEFKSFNCRYLTWKQ
jgi:hypothetical protein